MDSRLDSVHFSSLNNIKKKLVTVDSDCQPIIMMARVIKQQHNAEAKMYDTYINMVWWKKKTSSIKKILIKNGHSIFYK